jgi:ABC-type multidrug transport system fused ATPase/permease subunit
MVLDAGKLLEFGTPKELLKRTNGAFTALVAESSDKEELYAIAEGNAVPR